MRTFFILCLMFITVNVSHAYTGIYLGWENFISPALPENTTGNNLVFGVMGTTPTRVYFYYNILGHMVNATGETTGQLGWGVDLAGGIGYRFLNTAHKRSGWDVGVDAFGYFTNFFLNSESGYIENALYYGAGLGVLSMYKINPNLGVGLRGSFKFNIGTDYLSSKLPSTMGLLYSIGAFLVF